MILQPQIYNTFCIWYHKAAATPGSFPRSTTSHEQAVNWVQKLIPLSQNQEVPCRARLQGHRRLTYSRIGIWAGAPFRWALSPDAFVCWPFFIYINKVLPNYACSIFMHTPLCQLYCVCATALFRWVGNPTYA